MTIERIPITSREQWLELRKPDVTASVVGALFGVHPYVSALKLYLQHSGIEFSEPDSAVTRRGRLLESAVALAVEEQRPDWRIEKCTDYFRDPELRLGATPDFFIHDDPRGLGVLQTKTAAPHVYERDWQNGDVTPFWIQLQNLTEVMLTGAAFGVVAVLRVDAFDLACSMNEVPRLAGAEKRIIDGVRGFWADVAAHREPDPDYAKDAELLRLIAPHEEAGKTIDLSGDNEILAMLDQREEIIAQIIKPAEARVDGIDTAIKFRIRDAERVIGLPEWSISWKTSHRPEYTVQAKDVRTLRIQRRTEKKKKRVA
jgi:predicted phage-related endonuclease